MLIFHLNLKLNIRRDSNHQHMINQQNNNNNKKKSSLGKDLKKQLKILMKIFNNSKINLRRYIIINKKQLAKANNKKRNIQN